MAGGWEAPSWPSRSAGRGRVSVTLSFIPAAYQAAGGRGRLTGGRRGVPRRELREAHVGGGVDPAAGGLADAHVAARGEQQERLLAADAQPLDQEAGHLGDRD